MRFSISEAISLKGSLDMYGSGMLKAGPESSLNRKVLWFSMVKSSSIDSFCPDSITNKRSMMSKSKVSMPSEVCEEISRPRFEASMKASGVGGRRSCTQEPALVMFHSPDCPRKANSCLSIAAASGERNRFFVHTKTIFGIVFSYESESINSYD